MTEPTKAILLITKTPGRLPVKTRLAVDLDETTAVELYRCFLRDIGAKFRQLKLPLMVHHLPGSIDEQDVLTDLLGQVAGMYPQLGHDLGARMSEAFRRHFADGAEQLVLIGGDCPDLPPEIFNQAFSALDSHDCVLGPTRDGGYYLIGFTRAGYASVVFDFEDWGASTVYGETLERLQTAGKSYFELEQREDIDTLAELQHVYSQNQQGWFADSATMRLVQQIGINA